MIKDFIRRWYVKMCYVIVLNIGKLLVPNNFCQFLYNFGINNINFDSDIKWIRKEQPIHNGWLGLLIKTRRSVRFWHYKLFCLKVHKYGCNNSHVRMYVYAVHSISFQTFFVQAFKIVVDSGTFSLLLLYILWYQWPIFMISGSNEQLQ